MSTGSDGHLAEDAQRKPFLASPIFIVPWVSWQAWVLGATLRQRRGSPSGQQLWRPAVFVAGVVLLFLFAQVWLSRVLVHVPEPYLDEFFHIPQAQKYCEGRWLEWDNKITTPPGLYLFSVLYQSFWRAVDGCSVWALRGANTIAIMLVAMAACACRAALEHQAQQRQTRQPGKLANSMFSLYAFHTALNVALFPVLFFFSALYYTDVYSTLVTLVAYRLHLFRQQYAARNSTPPFWSGLLVVVFGLATLLMRQTNIFWAVVYMGGLEAVQAVKTLRSTGKSADARPANMNAVFSSPLTMAWHYIQRYSQGDIHDPPVGESWPDDWVLSLASIAVAAICHPVRVLRHVWPHVVVLGSFVGFVAWNGGVVLGDKSNHVATLHLAQLLYIWPLFAFFSAPLFVSHALAYTRQAWTLVVGAKQKQKPDSHAPIPAAPILAHTTTNTPMRLLGVIVARKAYYPAYLLAVLVFLLAVVRYNTIVHPFTLADNRHYMFYVFRYTIRRATWLRYALAPVYAATAWACWRVLWSSEPGQANYSQDAFVNSPFATPAVAKSGSAAVPAPEKDAVFLSLLDEEPAGRASTTSTATSTALLWLLASSLSLVTAPLVEPRYFILPWVFWRLLVPAEAIPGRRLDGRLTLETLWHVAINVATMYIFLFRPYIWYAEDGSLLDDGRLQRFMW